MIDGPFFHLLPDSLKKSEDVNVLIFVMLNFVLFFIIVKVLHSEHFHKEKCDIHKFHYMILMGDSVHNFIYGFIIANSFIVTIQSGFSTNIDIAAHEIPQILGILVF